MEDWRNGGFGLYIHWPFCQSKCPYCDFNSHVASGIDQDLWLGAYLAELDRYASETKGRVLSTIFFGGGTPSLMSPDLVSGILDRVRRNWLMSNDPEITLEANPGSVEAGRFAAYRQAGVNRISMGLQALNDTALRLLGRTHTTAEALAAFDVARNLFDRVSFDLIYARQDQTLTAWRTELRQALSLAVDHLSLYQLTIEDGTVFAARHSKGGLRGLPDENRAVSLFEETRETCETLGFPAYEVSNHARPGAESRHNLIYWRGGDYVGLGPGAHGRLTLSGLRYATEAPRSPDEWLKLANSGGAELPRVALTATDHATEYTLMSLRLSEGTNIDRLENILGRRLDGSALADMCADGLLEIGANTIVATGKGRLLLNSVIAKVLSDLKI